MTFAQVIETLVNVTSNSPSQVYTHLDDHNLRTYDTVITWFSRGSTETRANTPPTVPVHVSLQDPLRSETPSPDQSQTDNK